MQPRVLKSLLRESQVRADRPVPPETEAAMAQVATDRLNPMEAFGFGVWGLQRL